MLKRSQAGNTTNLAAQIALPPGVYNLDDLKQFAAKKGVCPYFLARHAMQQAHLVVYSYHYLLDPKVNDMKQFAAKKGVRPYFPDIT